MIGKGWTMFSLIGVLCTGIFLAIAGSVLGFKGKRSVLAERAN